MTQAKDKLGRAIEDMHWLKECNKINVDEGNTRQILKDVYEASHAYHKIKPLLDEMVADAKSIEYRYEKLSKILTPQALKTERDKMIEKDSYEWLLKLLSIQRIIQKKG